MKWLHNILRGFSLTGALFVFQACYGMPEPPLYEEGGEAPMSFSVVSRTTGEPVEGVMVKGSAMGRNNLSPLGITGADGNTMLTDLRERDILIKMDPSL